MKKAPSLKTLNSNLKKAVSEFNKIGKQNPSDYNLYLIKSVNNDIIEESYEDFEIYIRLKNLDNRICELNKQIEEIIETNRINSLSKLELLKEFL